MSRRARALVLAGFAALATLGLSACGSDYPASGKLTLPFGCDGQGTTSHTYTVWPAGTHDVSRTITVSAHSDG